MQVVLGVEGPEELDDEWMVGQALHHFELTEDLFIPAVLFHDEPLRHRLDRVQGACVLLADQVDFLSESTLSDDLYFLVVLHRHARLKLGQGLLHRAVIRPGHRVAQSLLLGRNVL